jgi:hypothetical protein
VCFEVSLSESTSPYKPARKYSPPLLLMAVVTNILLPQTTGLECASPGMGVFHSMFVPLVASQVTGAGLPSATPEAFAPRNDGQF